MQDIMDHLTCKQALETTQMFVLHMLSLATQHDSCDLMLAGASPRSNTILYLHMLYHATQYNMCDLVTVETSPGMIQSLFCTCSCVQHFVAHVP